MPKPKENISINTKKRTIPLSPRVIISNKKDIISLEDLIYRTNIDLIDLNNRFQVIKLKKKNNITKSI